MRILVIHGNIKMFEVDFADKCGEKVPLMFMGGHTKVSS
jgi:hypothetical protein